MRTRREVRLGLIGSIIGGILLAVFAYSLARALMTSNSQTGELEPAALVITANTASPTAAAGTTPTTLRALEGMSATTPTLVERDQATATMGATPLPIITPTRMPAIVVEPTPEPIQATETAPPEPTPIASIVMTVGAWGANVRSSPEFGANVIGIVERGDELIVLDANDRWYLVRLGQAISPRSYIANEQGWIVRELVNERFEPAIPVR